MPVQAGAPVTAANQPELADLWEMLDKMSYSLARITEILEAIVMLMKERP